MRWTGLVVACLLLAAGCSDLRDFRGRWKGARVGDSALVRVGVGDAATATLDIDEIDTHGLGGVLSISGLVADAPVHSIPGAEADALAGITFAGSPLRVYLSFISIADGQGDALALVALYDHGRVEVRIMRGGATPLYAIFSLTEEAP